MDLTQNTPTRHQAFDFTTTTFWTAGLKGVLRSEGKPSLDVSSPPEFKGMPGVWSPEELFVASINACLMETFLASVARTQIVLKAYESGARGSLEYLEGVYRFSKILLTPRIVVGPGASTNEVSRLIHEAHLKCFITRSVTTDVEVVPEIVVG